MSAKAAIRSSDAPALSGNGSAPGREPRRLGPRRTLPGSRAVTGGLLVAAAAVGLFGSYASMNSGPSEAYVVASRPIAGGTRIEPADLALERMELPDRVRARAFDDPSVLVGATAVARLEPGELVQPSAVVAKGGDEAARELSFPIERGHLSAALEEGERVDVIATFGTGNDSFTTVVLRSAQVVAIERAKVGLGDGSTAVVAVSVSSEDDEVALAHAIQEGKLTLVRATGAPVAGSGPPATYRADPAVPGR